MVKPTALAARAAKLLTDCTWETQWNVYAPMYGFDDFLDNNPRLLRSQSWQDPDYPEWVTKLFVTAVKEDELNGLNFITYVISDELNLENPEVITQGIDVLQELELITTDGLISPQPITSLSPYIQLTNIPDDFYIDLLSQINTAYSANLFVCVRILVRKMMENLLIDILRKKYGMTGVDTFFNTAGGRFHGFERLLKNTSERIGDFQPICQEFDKDFIRKMDKYRHKGNSSAHSIELNIVKTNADNDKDEIEFIFKILIRTYNCTSS